MLSVSPLLLCTLQKRGKFLILLPLYKLYIFDKDKRVYIHRIYFILGGEQ